MTDDDPVRDKMIHEVLIDLFENRGVRHMHFIDETFDPPKLHMRERLRLFIVVGASSDLPGSIDTWRAFNPVTVANFPHNIFPKLDQITLGEIGLSMSRLGNTEEGYETSHSTTGTRRCVELWPTGGVNPVFAEELHEIRQNFKAL